MRILHVLDHSVPLHSGYAFRTLAILREQRRQGWDPVPLTTTKHYGATADEEEVNGFRFYRTRVPAGGWRGLPLLDQWSVIHDTERRLAQVVAATRPDLLHAHSPCLNGIAAIRVGKRQGLPVVYEMRASWEDAAVDHGTTTEGSLRYRMSRQLETWTLQRADAVTTICEGLRQDILRRGIPEARVTVIPNAVDIDQFSLIKSSDAELQVRLGLTDAFVLGFLGSFYGYEGLSTLIEALPLVLRIHPHVRLVLVGGGPEEARLRSLVGAMGLNGVVTFVGRVPHSEVHRYYSVIDLLVFPRKSIRLTETVTPLKPLEAMAQGRLVLASDVGGHRELVSDGATGFLFKADDERALAAKIVSISNRRDQLDGVKRQARKFVEEQRTWRVSVGGYRAVYDGVLAARRSP